MFIASSISPDLPVQPWVITASALMLGLAALCVLVRFAIGPRTPDRMVALDLLASLVIASLLITGIASGSPFQLQTVLGFALVLFLSTVALSRYLDRPGGGDS